MNSRSQREPRLHRREDAGEHAEHQPDDGRPEDQRDSVIGNAGFEDRVHRLVVVVGVAQVAVQQLERKCQYCTDGRSRCRRLVARHDLRRGLLARPGAGPPLRARADEEHDVDDDRHQPHDQDPRRMRRIRKRITALPSRSRSTRGSKASRTPSPKMLKASVVISRARLGKTRYHQAYW